MKTNKLAIRALVVLGFGSTVGLVTGCANLARKSPTSETAPAADSVVVKDGDAPVRVMYGVPPARFDENRPVRERAL